MCFFGCTHNPMNEKGVKLQTKPVKIKEMFMFRHLKPWQSWQDFACSFICMSKNSNKKPLEEIWK